MLIFGASINCIPWVYSPELLPLRVRAKGYGPPRIPDVYLPLRDQQTPHANAESRQAIAISASWLWNFFVSMIAPTLIKELVWKGYLIFMCMNLSFVPVGFPYPLHFMPSGLTQGARPHRNRELTVHPDRILLLPRDGQSHPGGDRLPLHGRQPA